MALSLGSRWPITIAATTFAGALLFLPEGTLVANAVVLARAGVPAVGRGFSGRPWTPHLDNLGRLGVKNQRHGRVEVVIVDILRVLCKPLDFSLHLVLEGLGIVFGELVGHGRLHRDEGVPWRELLQQVLQHQAVLLREILLRLA